MDINIAANKIGISILKKEQIKIIKKIVEKKLDTIALLPTGFGKSACYIIPHLMMNKNVIVISPLISLMEDQCSKLKKYNIPYLCFNSLHLDNSRDKLNPFSQGIKTGIMYFSPESFLTRKNFIIKLILSKSIGLICIDESHCLSSWDNFRSSYQNLNVIQKWRKNKDIPILCLTASATSSTIQVMMENLGLERIKLVKASFYKPQLVINCFEKTNIDSDINRIINYISRNKGKTIIYTKTIKESEKISFKLTRKNIDNDYYHSKRPLELRKDIQRKFTQGLINTIVSTIAFGMGIDIPDIHLVVHYGISKDIESYYQEIGRGGRDGKETKCITLWGKKDFIVNQLFNKKEGYIDKTRNYLYDNDCRQKFICKYFGEEISNCGKCDNCVMIDKSKNIPIYSSFIIFSIIKSFDDRSYSIDKHSLYNLLKKNRIRNIKDYKNIYMVSLLINEDWIKVNNNKLRLTKKSYEFLKINQKKINDSIKIIKKWITTYRKENEIRNLLQYFDYK